MSMQNSLDKIVTYIIIVLFLFGIWEATMMVPSDTPWYNDITSQIASGNPSKLIDLVKMGVGWTIITPTIHVSKLPFWFSWYGQYYSLFVPSGYIPMIGWEIFMFVAVVFIFIMLPLAIIVKKYMRQKNKRKPIDAISFGIGLPWWFYVLTVVVLLSLYPLWCWFNINLFIYGAMGFFGIPYEAAYGIWLSFGERTESISLFFLVVSILGIYKGTVWSKKFKVF